ncbi:hypothetical protein AEA09_04120 [Lysinibacillus contaminans]|uniref:Lipoprotein n=1 Tax=Lysinibacillus contaminans TaxID=1293441 RepID=A0ABR5JYV0_9BACI|nr:DUF6612 family protein [Lysinibacillus contaminans]KOS67819.1 hypothetical protein AEA09_04120 [Lysinibacillus contaminans]
MKKIFTILSAGAVALVLTACNNSATPTKETTATSSLTLEQVYDKAMDRQADVKSMSASMDMTQVMKFGAGEESMDMNIGSQMEIDMITKPLAMHLSGSMTMPDVFSGGAENSSLPIEMYMKQDQGFFMKDPTTEVWMKLPSEEFDAILDQTAASANAKEQLEQLKQYIDDFTFEQTDDSYVLTLNAKGDQFKELIQSEVNKSLGTGENPLEGLTIDKANYVIHIDKETFDTNKIDMNFDLKMSVEGQESTIQTKSVVTYTEINHLDTIDIPQSIIDSATVVEN